MLNVRQSCREVFSHFSKHLTCKNISHAFAVTSLALAALAGCSLKNPAYFRWPVAIVVASNSIFFLSLHLVLSYPTLIFRNVANSEPEKMEEHSTRNEEISSSLLSQMAKKIPPFALTSVALAALAYFSLKGPSYFRWPATLVVASNSVFFLGLHLVLSRSTLIFGSEAKSPPQKIEEDSEQNILPGEANGSLQKAQTILETHGIYSFETEEISACIQTEDLQKRLLNPEEDPNMLCKELEKQLCEQAKKALGRRWNRYCVDNAMEWVEILVNLKKKPNPYEEGAKALALADSAPVMLASYGDYRLSMQSRELFPLVNFLVWQIANQSLPPSENWPPEDKKKFFTILKEMIQNKHHTIIKLDILKHLTAEGYTLTEIKAAGVNMKPTPRDNQKLSQPDLLERALKVLKNAKRASEELQAE